MGSLRAGLGSIPGLQNQSAAQTINGSLRFDSASSLYLSRSFSSTGNQKTCTFSAWLKRSKLGTVQFLFEARDATGDSPFQFNADDTATIGFSDGTYALTTSQVFRDASAWYHIVIAFDTTQSAESDRVKLYVNGSQITQFSGTYPPQDHVFAAWNKTGITHYISNYTFAGPRLFMDCMSSNIYFIDGQALGPGFFGFTDPKTGTWRPKRLKDGAPTVNDGTDWAANYTGGVNPGLDVNNLWDGDTGTYVNSVWGGDPLEYTLPNVPFEGLQIHGFIVGSSSYVKVNGIDVSSQLPNSSGSRQYVPITGVGNVLKSITVYNQSSGDYVNVYGVKVDGVTMVRNTTTNIDFGTNGFYLPLDDQDDYTTDKSGKGNNWTANNFSGTFSNPDVVPDSPSGVVGSTKPTSGITTTSSITKPTNYATWNPAGILKESGSTTSTLSDGNLKITFTSGTNASNQHFSTIGASSGKYYCEWTAENDPSSNSTAFIFGVQQITDYRNNFLTQTGGYAISSVNQLWNNGSNTNSWWSGTAATGDTFALALDLTNSQITFYRNGSSLGDALSIPSDKEYAFCMQVYQWQGTPVGTANFGQRPFKHQPPAGYLTLCSANVRPSKVVTRPGDYVGVTTYIGTGASGQSVSDLNFQSDLIWIKSRTGAYDHRLFDSVRGFGSGKALYPNDTVAEGDYSVNDGALSVSSTGWTFTTAGARVNDATSYVGWCWKAGGNKGTYNVDDVGYATTTAAGLTNGTHAHLVTGASVGTKQGFSIIGFDATAMSSAPVELPHGLTETPGMIIVKARDNGIGPSAWYTWHQKLSNLQENRLFLNGANTEAGNTIIWNNTAPTNTTFWVGGDPHNNDNAIAYVWHDVPGLQKFGSYTGNGTADNGSFVELGFRPTIILIKRITSGTGGFNWTINDSERNKYNPSGTAVFPNLSNQESTNDEYEIDFLSNGFKPRCTTPDSINVSDQTYIYAAWAEAPTHNLFGGQSLAR